MYGANNDQRQEQGARNDGKVGHPRDLSEGVGALSLQNCQCWFLSPPLCQRRYFCKGSIPYCDHFFKDVPRQKFLQPRGTRNFHDCKGGSNNPYDISKSQ